MKGYPPLKELSVFDRGKGLIVEEMHGGYLGVAKMLLQRWTKRFSENVRRTSVCLRSLNFLFSVYAFYQLGDVKARMQAVLPPPECNRPPKDFDLSTWKSSMYRDWVFHYALPCCLGILDDDVLEHFVLFTEAVTLLSSEVVHPVRDVENALSYLLKFQQDFTDHYGICI